MRTRLGDARRIQRMESAEAQPADFSFGVASAQVTGFVAE
jgi:hypothetical protein